MSDETEEKVVHGPRRLFLMLLAYARRVIDITEGTDAENTTAGIKRDIDFKGHNVWILVFSIYIASIGLNTNSGAVIIGAMLISPLMGPILGVGLSLGTNDVPTLRRSLRSFATMTIIAVLTSTSYFFLTPLSDAQSELLARTNPTLLDVFVAFFGGLAGIMAGSRKEKTNVIPGVAIATALMPPLCTAGFGLATGQFHYFFGAFYLFILNSIFICLATVIVVRYLRFPMVEILDPVKERRARRLILVFSVLIILPSLWIFYNVVQESLFYRRANMFISEVVKYDENLVTDRMLEYSGERQEIVVVFEGGKSVPPEIKEQWVARLPEYGLEDAQLKVVQSARFDPAVYQNVLNDFRAETFSDLYYKNQEALAERERRISELVMQISGLARDTLPFKAIGRELKAQYEDLERFSFGQAYGTDFTRTDTLCVVLVHWKTGLKSRDMSEMEEQMSRWLKVRLREDSVAVIRN
ncbi:MAG: DUF389 domain-containing protein [Flavobacteriales bacterium]|nr:DUF389 domain-containing protein [Flavobacteriales bacterium]